MNLSEAIRSIRRRTGKTLVQLALDLGVKNPTVSQYESGKAKPSPKVLLLLLAMAEGEERQPIMEELHRKGVHTADDAMRMLGVVVNEDEDVPEGVVRLAQCLRSFVQRKMDVYPILLDLLDLWEKHGSDPRFSDFWSRLTQFVDRELEHRLGRRPLRQPKYIPPPEPGGPPYSKDDPRYENQILWVMTYCYYDKKPFWTGFTTTQKHYENARIPDMRAVCPYCQISQVWNRDNAWLALPGSQR